VWVLISDGPVFRVRPLGEIVTQTSQLPLLRRTSVYPFESGPCFSERQAFY
jgi:hypothetical protein